MSSPACADGYDTPAQQREDSTTFMVSIDSDQRPAPRRFAASPALHAPTHLDTLVEPDWLTVPILSLLRQCLGTIGVQGAPLTHPDNEVALELLLDFLDAAEQGRVDDNIAFVPAARYAALRMAATRARSSIPRSQPPPPLPQLSSSAAAARPRLPLNVELWSFDGHICKAIGPDPIPVQYWVERLADELAGQGFTQTDHGITQGHFLRQLLKPPLSDTLITKIALLPAVDAAIVLCLLSIIILCPYAHSSGNAHQFLNSKRGKKYSFPTTHKGNVLIFFAEYFAF